MTIKPLNYLLFPLCLLVMGCSQNPQPLGKPLPQLTYAHLNAYKPFGGGVEVRQSYVADAQTIKTAKEFPIMPDALLGKYAFHRFDRYQRPIKLIFDIKQSSLIKKADEDNLVGFLSGAAEDYYTLQVAIAMSPVRGDGSLSDPFTINLKRELYLPQRLSLAEREFRQFEFLEQIIIDIDRVVTQLYEQRMRR